MNHELKVEMWFTDKIIPYARNAKEHPPEQISQIAASIVEFGFNDAISVDEKGVIIEGHGRLLAAQKLGIKEVPVIQLKHMTEAQKRAYIIAHNKLTMNSKFDVEMLRIEIDDLKSIGLDLELTGFDIKELDSLFAIPVEKEKSYEGSQELSIDDFDKFECKCPRCGFEFNK